MDPMGDVIEEESRIYGDGVNIAARLESLADPGGICISKTAFDQIETKLPFGYEFLGEQTVKNIARPVGAYRALMEPRITKGKGARYTAQGKRRKMAVFGLVGALLIVSALALWQFVQRSAPPPVEKADPKKMAFPLPNKPSIAVGSILRAGDRLRVTAQLIDAVKGHHLWSERYDREPKDLFGILDDITKNIVTALHINLTWGESARMLSKGTENIADQPQVF